MLTKIFAKQPVIKFSTYSHLIDVIPAPIEAKKAIPKWYRKLKSHTSKTNIVDGTAKRCIPILDAFSQGYVIPLWTDMLVQVGKAYTLYDSDKQVIADVFHTGDASALIGETVSDVDGNPKVASVQPKGDLQIRVHCPIEKFAEGQETISGHAWEQVSDLCDLKKFDFGKTLLKFTNPWSISTPTGWSCYFKNPANDWSNEIHLLEGVVDTDTFGLPVNFPFVWTGGDTGEFLIPKGTPLVQVIPFKRTEVVKQIEVRDEEAYNAMQNRITTKLFDRYKQLFWHKRNKYVKHVE